MKRLAIIGICIVLALSALAVGCGEEETTTTAAPQTTTTAAPATTTTAAPATTTTAAPETTTTAGMTYSRKPIEGVEPIELTLVGFLPDIPPGADWHNDFIKKVSEYSGGAMTIKFSGPEAVPAMDQPAAVQRGTFDMASILSMFSDSLVEGCGAIGRAEYNPMQLRAKAKEDGAYKYYEDAFAKVGIKYLGASVSSEPQVQTVIYLGKEVASLADLKGLKIASPGGSNRAFIDSLGATTIPVDFTDYFTSMERGTVDGYNIGIPGVEDFGLIPVTKFMLDEPFSSCGGMMLMNLDKWNSLTEKQKAVITQAMVNTEIDGAVHFTKTVEKVKADLEAAGVKILHLNPDEAKTFYTAYRDTMWAADMDIYKNVAPKLKEWLVNPTFPRANN